MDSPGRHQQQYSDCRRRSEANIGRETFSPDGNYVYYQAYDKDNPQGALFQVPAFGGVPRKILSNITSVIALSPDGSRFAFIRNDNVATGEDQLIVANADGSNESKLAARKGDAFFLDERVELVA